MYANLFWLFLNVEAADWLASNDDADANANDDLELEAIIYLFH